MAKSRGRKRADLLLVERRLAESREQAQTLIAEGLVFSRAGRVLKSSSLLAGDAEIDVRGSLPYVSRGGLKLAHALDEFGISVNGLTALDVGASTGGFTDCMLQRARAPGLRRGRWLRPDELQAKAGPAGCGDGAGQCPLPL